MELEAGAKPNLRIDTIEGPQACQQFEDLLDRSFPVRKGGHFFDDFPVWDTKLNPPSPKILRFGVYAGEKLIASTAVRIAELRTPAGPLPIGLIGGVTTDEQWRSRGLASKLVSIARDWATQRDAALVLLWGSEHSLYRKIGFELCGEQVRLPLTALDPPSTTTSVNQGWTPEIFKSLQGRATGLALGPQDQKWFSAHKNVSWFWTGPPENPTAYAAFGRGIDLQGLVHEWGGARQDLLAILATIARDHPEAEILGHPRFLKEAFAIDTDPAKTEFLCMAHLADPLRCLKSFVPAESWQLERKGEDWIFVRGAQSFTPLTELGSVIFGPEKVSFFGNLLPAPLWIWGLDGA